MHNANRAKEVAIYPGPVEALWAARNDFEAGHVLHRHQHECGQFLLVLEGGGRFLLGSKRFDIQRGDLLVMHPMQIHSIRVGRSGPLRTLQAKYWLRDRELGRACRRIPGRVRDADGSARARLEAILSEGRGDKPYAQQIANTHLFLLLLTLMREQEAGGAAQRKVVSAPERPAPVDPVCARVEAYLREHSSESLSAEQMSREVGYSYRHLSAQLKRHLGTSPHKLLKQIRIEQAMSLMRDTDHEIKLIAERVGFSTVHHFTRVFTQVAGVSPARWRETERAGMPGGYHFRSDAADILAQRHV